MSISTKILGIFLTFFFLIADGAALPKTRRVYPKEYLKSIPQKILPKKRVKPSINEQNSSSTQEKLNKEENLEIQKETTNKEPEIKEELAPWESDNPEKVEKELSWIIRNKDLPWEELSNGERRKIYKESNIQLHLIQSVVEPKSPTIYKENVTCYVISGDMKVWRESQQKELAVTAGDTFFIPAGDSFVRKSSSKGKVAFLVEFFSAVKPTRLQLEEISKNEVMGFIHRWFALLDQKSPTSNFINHLGNKIYKISFSEPAITSKAQFQKWYEKKFLKTIYSNSYKIENIQIHTKDVNNGVYEVLLHITWIATRKDKKSLENFYQEQWIVQKDPQLPLGFTILDYKVEQTPSRKVEESTEKSIQNKNIPLVPPPAAKQFYPSPTETDTEEDLWDDDDDEDTETEETKEEEENNTEVSTKNTDGFFEDYPSMYTFSG